MTARALPTRLGVSTAVLAVLLSCAPSAGGAPAPVGTAAAPLPAAVQSNANAGSRPDVPVSTPLPRQQRVSLIDHATWQILDATADPFADRPSQIACNASGVKQELLAGEDAFGVDTGTCGYITARAWTRDSVEAGEVLRIRLWHFKLTAPARAEAHAVVELDGTTLLDERIAIPADGGLIKRELVASRAFAAGVPLLFHLHNHGDNSWALVEVSAGP